LAVSAQSELLTVVIDKAFITDEGSQINWNGLDCDDQIN
jgi:hypothetical protein